MFEVTGVSKTFGDLQALREVDLSVHPEQTTVLIGPSGCGQVNHDPVDGGTGLVR